MKVRGLVIVALLLLARPAHGELSFDVNEIAPGVIVFASHEAGIGNAVAIVTDRDVLVVDSKISPSESAAILDAIRERTDKPVRYLINTHWHDDHVWGNQSFTAAYPGVEILSHRQTRAGLLDSAVPALAGQIARLGAAIDERTAMIESGVDKQGDPLTEAKAAEMSQRIEMFRTLHTDMQAIEPTPPTLVFERELILHRGDETIQIIHLGKAHTDGDIVVYLPERKVLIAGDAVTRPFPAAAEAHLLDWIDVLKQVDELQWDQLVPGHGSVVGDHVYVRDLRALLVSVVEQVERAVANGESLEDTIASVDVSDLRARFVTEGSREDMGFDRFFLKPAIESAYREFSE